MGITVTDVAKDASDMISWTTASPHRYAVREGRRVFRNIRRWSPSSWPTNVAQIVVLLTAVALNWNAPLTAVMILWVNLATRRCPRSRWAWSAAAATSWSIPPMRVNNLLDGPLARRVIFQGVFHRGARAGYAFVIGQNAGSYELAADGVGRAGIPRCCAP